METLLHTIGYSNHPIQVFIGYLKKYSIETIIDVRSQPYSRFNPMFCHDKLRQVFARHDVEYKFFGKHLGGRTQDPEYYRNGRVDYNLLSRSANFQQGLKLLISEIASATGCLMCAEKDPLSCHRTILICRRLRGQKIDIHHILPDGSVELHSDLEKRLVKTLKLSQLELFEGEDGIVERAYELQGQIIAYHKK